MHRLGLDQRRFECFLRFCRSFFVLCHFVVSFGDKMWIVNFSTVGKASQPRHPIAIARAKVREYKLARARFHFVNCIGYLRRFHHASRPPSKIASFCPDQIAIAKGRALDTAGTEPAIVERIEPSRVAVAMLLNTRLVIGGRASVANYQLAAAITHETVIRVNRTMQRV